MSAVVDFYLGGTPTAIGLNTKDAFSQSFTGDGGTLHSAKFRCYKVGSLSGTIYYQVYSHSGSFGTSSVPGTLLAQSDGFSTDSVPTSPVTEWIEDHFSGDQKITLENGTKYVVVIYCSDGDLTNYVATYVQNGSAFHDGNYASRNRVNQTWNPTGSADMSFYVYKDSESPSQSTSPSVSPSASVSPSISVSPSESPSPSPGSVLYKICSDYLNISNSNVGGWAQWFAGRHSLDTLNNDGWIFDTCHRYTDKYSTRNTTWADKYSSKGTTYTDKLSSTGGTWTDKYSSKGTTYTDKHSDKGTSWTKKYDPNDQCEQ